VLELTGAVYLQMKMQDLLKTDCIYSSKKDDAVSHDDDGDAAEAGQWLSQSASGPPAVEEHDGVISPLVVDNSAATAAKGSAPVEQLLLASTGQPLLRIPAVGLMFADTLYGAPTLLPELVNRWGALHKILIILTIRQVPLPLTVAWNHCFVWQFMVMCFTYL